MKRGLITFLPFAIPLSARYALQLTHYGDISPISYTELAKKIGRKQVVLEVVDTNPQARKLYERLGFRVFKEENTGLLTKKAGFEKVYYMVKDIG